MSTFLSIGTEDLGALSSRDAVAFFADLLRAEAASLGLPLSGIRAPLSINPPDGGIDIEVRMPAGASGQGLIMPGLVCYQIKTGPNVRFGPSGWKRVLCGNSQGSLSPRVETCIDEGGTLVVVLFGVDKPYPRGDPADSLREYLKEHHSRDRAKVAVWQQSDLLGFLGPYAALKRRLGRTDALFLDHPSWSGLPEMQSRPFVLGEEQDAFVEGIRSKLRAKGVGSADIRITGTPGSGKTRIAREITDTDDLRPLTMYFDRPAPDVYAALDAMVREESQAVVVVDECEDSEWERLRGRAGGAAGRIKLVTIHNGNGNANGNANGNGDTALAPLPKLDLQQITKIISGHLDTASDEDVEGLARLCVPSPRYAHRLAARLKDSKIPVKEMVNEDSVHNMYIADSLAASSSEFQRRKAVLMWFALFERVGYEGDHSGDAGFVAAKIAEWEGMRRGEFNRIVDDLRRLKILQGHRTLYVAPTLLQLWLWRDWWRINGPSFDLDGFTRADQGGGRLVHMPDDLFRWFSDMFVNARVSADAAKVASNLLGMGGPFEWSGAWKAERGARLFQALARADPDSALRLLGRTVGTWSYEQLAGFTTGRREVMWSLERLVRKDENFEAAADVIIRLAAAENEDHGGSATSIFSQLFTMAPNNVAYAQAGMDRRLAYLEKTLGSDDGRRRLVGIEACRHALESVHFSRMDHDRETMIAVDVTATKLSPRMYRVYKRVLDMLLERMHAMDREERKEAASAILSRVQELSRFRAMAEHTEHAARLLFDKGWADRGDLVEAVETVVAIDAERMAPRAAAKWRRLADDLAGKTYGERLRRYVAMSISRDMVGRSNGSAHPNNAERQIKKLAAEAVRSPKALLDESEWLFGPDVRNAAAFGEELARQDRRLSLLPRLLHALAAASEPDALLLWGYMRQVYDDGNVAAWENALDEMAKDPRLARLVPKVTCMSGMTDRAWDRVASLYRSGAIDKSGIAVFARGLSPRSLTDRAFDEALGILLDDPSDADTAAALALLHGGCAHDGAKRRLPDDEAYRVVTSKALLHGGGNPNESGIDYVGWKDVAMLLARQAPGRIGALAGALFGSIAGTGGMFDAMHPGAIEVLDYMGRANPDAVWDAAARHISSRPDLRTRQILEWAGGGWPRVRNETGGATTPFLNMIAEERVWEWIDGDRGARAALLAKYVPKDMARGRRCIARELLVRYGDSDAVRRSMHARFSTSVFLGSMADHYEKEMERCMGWMEGESDAVVLRWLRERKDHIRASMKKAAEFEERHP